MSADILPIAARIGFTHVSIAQTEPSGDWFAVLWSKEHGPTPLPSNGSYDGAVLTAQDYAARKSGVVLDLSDECRTIDVMRDDCGGFLVQELSAGGGSAGVLETFGPHEREKAVAYALRMVPQFSPCRLGEIAA